jgi:hypothetical protein
VSELWSERLSVRLSARRLVHLSVRLSAPGLGIVWVHLSVRPSVHPSVLELDGLL